MKFLKLIRYQNLLMLAFMQLVFRYAFFKVQNIPLALADWQYGLLILATVLIAAGGYVINNIFDQKTDTINKPKNVLVGTSISEGNAYNLYMTLTILGVVIGFYLSNVIMKPSFASIFIVIAATLYLYANSLKQMTVIGNFIVALLLSCSVLIIGMFDLLPTIDPSNQQQIKIIFSILWDYAIFTFLINFMREIIKDIEDIDGDYNQGMHTLPIVIGKSRTVKIVFGLSFIPILLLVFYINSYLLDLIYTTVYLLLFVLGPLFYFTVKVWSAKSKNDFHTLSVLLKWILFFGILSVVSISLNLKYNA